MSRFSPDTIDRVKQAADIVEVISAHTELRRQGVRFVGLCPFHDERTPSFSVHAQERFYYCFGCEAKGDVLTFVQEKEGLDFPEAVEAVADRYGVEVKREAEDPQAEERRQRLKRLQELLERTASFYSNFLWSGGGEAAKARSYLEERRVAEGTLRDFAIGLAPSAWDRVLLKGQEAGFSVEEMLAAGLAQRGRGGGAYDRFRARLMFPVRDARGRVVGFGARALRSGQQPKYLNSAESDLFHKSRNLFGIDRANSAIRKQDEALVVEGYMDVLALHQAGFTQAVAVMGTAITPEQLATLSGMAARVTLALDADESGEAAMLRAQKAARERKMAIRVVRMPEGHDPADLLARERPERFQELLDGAVSLPEFQVLSTLVAADLSSGQGRDAALRAIAPVLDEMPESIERDELIRVVADRLNVGPELVGQMIRSAGQSAAALRPGEPEPRPAPAPLLTPQERRERALLAMCIASPETGRDYLEKLSDQHLSSALTIRARDWLRAHADSPISGLSPDDRELSALITQLVMEAGRQPAPRHSMELNFLLLDQQRVERGIAEASARGDDTARIELVKRRAELVENLRSIEMADG
jgi:DNA primase